LYKDLCSCNSEKYWKDEGNNKRMRSYKKISKILKVTKYIFMFGLTIYILILSTMSMFYMLESNNCFGYGISTYMFDFKKFIFDTYKIVLIIILLSILYKMKDNKMTFRNLYYLVISSILLLPIFALLMFNFVILDSFMSSFYLLVIFMILSFIINQFSSRVDNLYNIAVGHNEVVVKKRKGEKICKGK